MIRFLTLAGALLIAGPLAAQPTPAPLQPAPLQPAPVQSAVTGMTLDKLLQQPAEQAAVIASAKAQFVQSPGACAAAQYRPTGDVTVFQPLQFGADGKPFAGVWVEPVRVTGCNPERLLNVLTITHAEGQPAHVALMPGTSHADPVTQKAALQYAQAVATRAAPPGCKQLAFLEARFLKFDGPPDKDVTDGRDARPWSEDWYVQECGIQSTINIRFKPNATGTQLAASNPVRH